MKVKVVKTFADKVTYKMYAVGEVIDLPDKRAEQAVKNGLVESAETAVKTPAKRKEKKCLKK